jgi:hypothetical protein
MEVAVTVCLCLLARAERSKALVRIGEAVLKFGKLREFRLEKELDQHWVQLGVRRLGFGLRLLHLYPAAAPGQYLLARAGRHRRQYAADAGPRAARTARAGTICANIGSIPRWAGFDIHWSRFVDLPIAGLILLLKPFLGNAMAERNGRAGSRR